MAKEGPRARPERCHEAIRQGAAEVRGLLPEHSQPRATLNEVVCFLQGMLAQPSVSGTSVVSMSSKIH